MHDKDNFRAEVAAWLEANCPPSMRRPIVAEEMVWGGSRLQFQNEDQRLWFERCRDKGWFAPGWPSAYGGGGLMPKQARIVEEEMTRLGCRQPQYNLGVWMDKFVFWLYPPTSESIIGPLRASVIYDLPVFMAYLCILPGMAVFLVRIETDFVEYYDAFFEAVRTGGSLEYIEDMRDEMVYSVRQGLAEIAKIQALALIVAVVLGPAALEALGISSLYLPLFYIQTLGASLQVGFLALLNIFFYLDRRRLILGLTALFCVANLGFTLLTLKMGAIYYGYGYAAAVLLALVCGLYFLDRRLGRLEYETFMLQ